MVDGEFVAVMGSFVATWAGLGFLYYRLGRMEQKLEDHCNNVNDIIGKKEEEV